MASLAVLRWHQFITKFIIVGNCLCWDVLCAGFPGVCLFILRTLPYVALRAVVSGTAVVYADARRFEILWSVARGCRFCYPVPDAVSTW